MRLTIYVHIYIHTYIYIYTYSYTYTYIYTCTFGIEFYDVDASFLIGAINAHMKLLTSLIYLDCTPNYGGNVFKQHAKC